MFSLIHVGSFLTLLGEKKTFDNYRSPLDTNMKKNKDDIFFENTLPTLIKDLKSNDRERILYAIEVVSAHASLSISLLPSLENLLNAENRQISRTAQNAINKINTMKVDED